MPEPLPSSSSLWQAPNLWITPHFAGDTVKGGRASIDLFCENLRFTSRRRRSLPNFVELRSQRREAVGRAERYFSVLHPPYAGSLATMAAKASTSWGVGASASPLRH